MKKTYSILGLGHDVAKQFTSDELPNELVEEVDELEMEEHLDELEQRAHSCEYLDI